MTSVTPVGVTFDSVLAAKAGKSGLQSKAFLGDLSESRSSCSDHRVYSGRPSITRSCEYLIMSNLPARLMGSNTMFNLNRFHSDHSTWIRYRSKPELAQPRQHER
jgi:hypothetical protein